MSKQTTDSAMRKIIPAVVALLAGLATGFSGLRYTAESDRLLWYWPAVSVIIGLALGGVFPGRAWLWSLIYEAGLQTGCLLAMVPDWLKDPTAHNLWPIALVLFGVLSWPAALAGSGLGWAANRWIYPPE